MVLPSISQKPTLPALLTEGIKTLIPTLSGLLPADMPLPQFRAALWLELTGRPDLAECTPESIRDCIVKSATYGLLPGRDVHFLPFRNKRKGGKRDATYVPNYLGIILALERSGKVRRAFAHAVYEGDEWGFDYFADRPIHKPALSLGNTQGKILFYYGAVLLKDGTCHFEVLTLADIEAVKRRAPSHEDGPWVTDPVMMARKTAIKRAAKYVKLTPVLDDMLVEDDARERADISEARHRQNIIDLFGDEAVNAQTGEIVGRVGREGAQEQANFTREGGKEARTTLGQGAETPETTAEDARGLPGDSPDVRAQGPSWGPDSPNLFEEEERAARDAGEEGTHARKEDAP